MVREQLRKGSGNQEAEIRPYLKGKNSIRVAFIGIASRKNSGLCTLLREQGFIVYYYESFHLFDLDFDDSHLPDLIAISHDIVAVNSRQILLRLSWCYRHRSLSIPVIVLSELNRTGPEFLLPGPVVFLDFKKSNREIVKAITGFASSETKIRRMSIPVFDPLSKINESALLKLSSESFFDLQVQTSVNGFFKQQKESPMGLCIIFDSESYTDSILSKLWDEQLGFCILFAEDDCQLNSKYIPHSSIVADILPVGSDVHDVAYSISRTLDIIQGFKMHDTIELSSREHMDMASLYRHVVENQKDIVFKWLPDGHLTFVNQAFSEITGCVKSELTGLLLTSFVPDSEKNKVFDAVEQMTASRTELVYEHQIIIKDGSCRLYQWTCSPIVDFDGNIIEFLSDGRDITEKSYLTDLIQKQSEEQSLLLNSIQTQIWYLNDQLVYRRVNRAHAEFLGSTSEKIQGKSFRDINGKTAERTIKDIIRTVLENKKAVYSECFLTNAKGENRLLAITSTPFWDKQQEITQIIFSALDITDQRIVEFNFAYRAEFEHLLNEISSSFLHHKPEILEKRMADSLRVIAGFTGADRAFLHFDKSFTISKNTFFSWPGERSRESFVSGVIDINSGVNHELKKNKVLHYPDVTRADGSNSLDKQYFEKNQIHSALYVPMEHQGKFAGVVGFEAINKDLNWDSDIQTLLKFYSDLLLQTQQKKQTYEIVNTEKELGIKLSTVSGLHETLNLCLEYAIYLSGMDSGGIYLKNDGQESMSIATHSGLSDRFIKLVFDHDLSSESYKLLKESNPIYMKAEQLPSIHHTAIMEEGLTYVCVLPIFYQDELVACVNLASHARDTIPHESTLALEALVARLGTPIVKVKIEEEIRRNWLSINAFFNTIADFIIVFNHVGKILHKNRAAEHQLGFTQIEPENQTIESIFYREDNQTSVLTELMEVSQNKKTSCLYPVISKTGKKLPAETKVVQGDWMNTRVWFALIHDLSRVKEEEDIRLEFEKQVQHARRIESLGRMAGAIAHRFNNLLMGVIGNLELAKMLSIRDKNPADKLDSAMKTARKATELSHLMLTYIGQGISKQEPCVLPELVTNLIPLLRTSAGGKILITVSDDDHKPIVNVDPNGFNQVLLNIVENAWESYSDKKGEIKIQTGVMDYEEIEEISFVVDEEIQPVTYGYVSVCDQGEGIEKGDLDKVFDPFYSTKFTGRGLGLSTALGIIKAHGGMIAIESEKNHGTEVIIFLPLIQ